jgi:hypothetical protein
MVNRDVNTKSAEDSVNFTDVATAHRDGYEVK